MVHADRRDNLAIITSEPLTNDVTDWYGAAPSATLIHIARHRQNHNRRRSIMHTSVQDVRIAVHARVSVPVNHSVLFTDNLHVVLAPICCPRTKDAISSCIASLTRVLRFPLSPYPPCFLPPTTYGPACPH